MSDNSDSEYESEDDEDYVPGLGLYFKKICSFVYQNIKRIKGLLNVIVLLT